MAKKSKKWIKGAIKPENKGKFASKAKAAGKSTSDYAREKADAPGALGKEARLAETLMGLNKGKKGGEDKPRKERWYGKKS